MSTYVEHLNGLLSYSSFTPEQISAVNRLFEHDATLLIASKGLGKTVIAQTAAQELLFEGVVKRVLVVAPPRVVQLAWSVEHLKWEHLSPVTVLIGTPAQRIKKMIAGGSIVVVSYELLPWLVKQPWFATFDGIVFDEITRMKSVGGTSFKSLRHRMKQFVWRCGLSATPVAEDPMGLYGQCLLLDERALGRNKDRFMHTYFMSSYMGYDWEPQPGGLERLATAVKDLVFVVESTEYEDSLPPLEEHVVDVKMGAAAWSAYEELAQTMVLEAEDIEAVNAAVLAGKLQQIASGFVYGEDGSAARLHSEKFIALDRLWHGRLKREPVIVMYNFIYELEELKKFYPGAKVLADDPAGSVAAWNAGELEMLLIHPRSAGHGLNLQDGGCLLIAMGPCWSADQHDQVIGRIWRRGQLKTVRRYILACEGTVDRVILDRLQSKKSDEGNLMQHLISVTQK
jgi:hypothetical protein